jgi:hypothetical protein
MTTTPDHLETIRVAARKLAAAEKRRTAALEALEAAVLDAYRVGIRPKLVMDAATMASSTYYRLISDQQGEE